MSYFPPFGDKRGGKLLKAVIKLLSKVNPKK